MIVKDNNLVVSITELDDIKKITEDTKYINIDIKNFDYKIIKYFIKNGQNYMYSDIVDGIYGYTYVNYTEFLKAEVIIENIYKAMPGKLDELEKARYLYIKLAKCIAVDINANTSKCEAYDLSLITNVSNLWGSLALGSVNEISANKIYYYMCRRLGLNAVFAYDNDKHGYVKLKIKNQALKTSIYYDIAYIAANMQTKYFANYNDDAKIDKKIGYIKDNYSDYYIDLELKDIDYRSDDFIWKILEKTQAIIDVSKIKPMELNTIYKYIFDKYARDYDIKINNLFLNRTNRFHFIVISYNDMHYSYNYKDNCFVEVTGDDIIDNLNEGKIGLYLDEVIPNVNYTKHLLG